MLLPLDATVGRLLRALATALACCALLALPAAAAAKRTHDWTRFGVNAARSNWFKGVAGIGESDLAKMVRQDIALPGTVDSSPVYLRDVQVKGGKRDVFIVSTSYGRVIAIGANTGAILWTYTMPSYEEYAHGKAYSPSSPVADKKAGFVYSVTPDGHVRKLRIRDGGEVLTQQWPAAVTRDPGQEKMSSSLNLSGDHVIATTAGHGGDIPPYQGHVAMVNRRSGAIDHVWNALCSRKRFLFDPANDCNEVLAGIWARAGAVVMPGSHRLLVSTGNAEYNGSTHWGDSVLQLSSDARRVVDSFTPANYEAMEFYDVDLGSTAPALLRSGKRWLGLQSGKDGNIRLLDLADMNGHGKACKCVGGELQYIYYPGDIGVFSTPAVWRKGKKSWAFVTTYETTRAYRLSNGKKPQLEVMWEKNRAGSSPVIAGGLLYVFDPVRGGISVYRPDTGKRVGVLATPEIGHWNSPVVADGRVAMGVGNANEHPTSGTFSIFRKP